MIILCVTGSVAASQSVKLAREFKRQGIGKALFNYVIQEQKKNNNKNMILWCLKGNYNSRKFYEKMGGNLYGENEIEKGGKKYKEVGYRYDLSIL